MASTSLTPLVLLFLAKHLTAASAEDVMPLEEPDSIDLFSSTEAVQRLFKKEGNIREDLHSYARTLDKQIAVLDLFLDSHYANRSFDVASSEEHVSNPVNTYSLLKRTAVFWPQAKHAVLDEDPAGNSTVQKMAALFDDLPKQSDLEGAAGGLFLLHETYNLDLKKFSQGKVEIPGDTGKEKTVISFDAKLDAADLELIGKLAFNRGFYDRATEWLDAAIWKASTDEGGNAIDRLGGILEVMRKKHDQVLVLRGPRGQDWRTFRRPFDPELRRHKKFKKITEKNKRYKVRLPVNKLMDQIQLWDAFNAACRKEDRLMRSPQLDGKLRCRFIHYGDPYLRLGPFRLEEKNLAPFVSVFHDFMPETASFIAAAAGQDLKRSRHYQKNGEPNGTTAKRTSSQIWLDEDKLEAAAKVVRRIALATRMHAIQGAAGEPYQLANYGIGGVYNHHTDSAGEEGAQSRGGFTEDILGDRIATAMIYLSDVTAGGATAFPSLGLSIWPKKGDMAFWYNNDINGSLDMLTFHGGCPVLVGSKWITNKWIRSRAQFRHFPCDVTRSRRRLKPLSNNFCEMTHACDIKFRLDDYPKALHGEANL